MASENRHQSRLTITKLIKISYKIDFSTSNNPIIKWNAWQSNLLNKEKDNIKMNTIQRMIFWENNLKIPSIKVQLKRFHTLKSIFSIEIKV